MSTDTKKEAMSPRGKREREPSMEDISEPPAKKTKVEEKKPVMAEIKEIKVEMMPLLDYTPLKGKKTVKKLLKTSVCSVQKAKH